MSDEPLGALKTPLGAIEPNVLFAGLEAAAAIWLSLVLVSDRPVVPAAFYGDWHWSVAVWALFALVGVTLLGLAVEGLAGALERLITWTKFNAHQLRPRFSTLLEEPPPSAWRDAQRWIWASPQASDEFARRRLRVLAARNTVVVMAAVTIALLVGLPTSKPLHWVSKFFIGVPAGMAVTVLFGWVWAAAQQGYNRAVRDAGIVGPP